MCGIVGIYSDVLSNSERSASIRPMLDSLAHRGPDGASTWSAGLLSFGHRRLAIQDISNNGVQPMRSHCGRYVITFNGEIYNFKDLRNVLHSKIWRGYSDTEVLVEGISEWGLDATLAKINGMFAFGLWDSVLNQLHLVRDSLGEKPLYVYHEKRTIVFASELRAIEELKYVNLTISRSAVTEFLKCGNVPWPETIYNEVSKIRPGTYLTFEASGKIKTTQYWSFESVITAAKSNLILDEADGISHIEKAISRAVKIRMICDVPFGAFLSGGTDSSLMVAMMQNFSIDKINTFSIGFNYPGYNEAEDAKLVSSILGTNHTELYITSADALSVVPNLSDVYDEPFSDSSQIPTLLVSQLARKHVTVAISGDGGDELFSGYLRYKATIHIWEALKKLPFRHQVATVLSKFPPKLLGTLLGFLKPLASQYGRDGNMAGKITRLIRLMRAKDIEHLYRSNLVHWENTTDLVVGGGSKVERVAEMEFGDFCEKMMYIDTIDYLEGDILQKVDRASMAHSLEVRVPLIDTNVIEAAWMLPMNMKRRNNVDKWVLKEVLGKYLPYDLIHKKKRGFGVPLDDWLRHDLSEWAQDLLSHDRLVRQGLFRPSIVEKTLADHLSGKENNGTRLWDILMLQQWLDANPRREKAL
jgi:asparagine synthase (glutamine-hydrolysing)